MEMKRRTNRGTFGIASWCMVVAFGAMGSLDSPNRALAAVSADSRQEQPPQAQEDQPEPKTQPAGQPEPAQEPVQPPESARQRAKRILGGIDPKLMNLSGAPLDVEVVGGTVIVRGTEDDIKVVELLAAVLESMRQQKELRVLTVSEKDAKEIAQTVGPAIADILRKPNQPPEDDVVVTAVSSNILLVAALPEDIDFVVEVIQKVDQTKEELPPLKQLVFPIKYRKARDVADQLKEIFTKMQAGKGVTGAKAEIQIIANDANNSIMVLAEEKEREKIEKLLSEIDVEPVPGWGEKKLTLYPLLHSKAADLAKVIEDLLKTEKSKEAAEEMIYRMTITQALPTGEIIELPPIDLQRLTRIIPDDGTNSLIVATAEENVEPLGKLIRLLDGVPMGEDVGVKLFPLRFADAETVSETLKTMFDEGKKLPEDPDGSGADAVPPGPEGKAVVYNISVTSDLRTNTVIVTGREEQLALVETIIGRLDVPASSLKFPLRILPLDYTDATMLGELITKLFEKRIEAVEASNAGAMAVERERVFLSVDIRTNSLIISASEENFAEIKSIAEQLDSRPTKLFEQIRIVALTRLNAEDMKTKIEELWKRKADLRSKAELIEDLPVVAVDTRSNSLIVASNTEDYEEILRLVQVLEEQPMIDDVQLFHLEFADAGVLAEMLKQLFEGIGAGSESFTAPTVLADPRSNAVVVAATRDGMEKAAELIKRLDVKAGPLTAVFKVYPLAHASAGQLSARVQELFDSRSENQEIKQTPVVILADEATNSLVCSASRDDHEIVVDLLGLLDRPSSLAKQFGIFPLKLAKAAQVAETLDTLFQSQAEGASQGRADAIATEADERTNAVIVWASPSQMINIAEVIKQLDTTSPVMEQMVKVIPLRQALAQDFAELLQNTIIEDAGSDEQKAVIVSFFEKMPDGSQQLRKLLRQDIKIEADPRTNSLLVMAPSDSMAMLEAMIKDFDAIRPIRSEVRLFPLTNSDAESMTEQLTELFKPTEGGAEGETKSQLVFGDTFGDLDVASVGQDLRFAADVRTNTLIAAGAEVDLRMVEDLVRYLDSLEAEDRVTEVVQTKYLEPSEIATAIKNFSQQEQDVLGEVEDREAQTRKAERQISVEAVGGTGENEQGGKSLIVGTSRRAYQQTMKMIEQLDRPEPQVRISVLIAEVSLTDDLELGVEVAGQDLHFSEEAIVGPNGVVQGSDFDYVGGTNLGAIGSGLGFNFTVAGEDFSFLFHALQQNTRLEILSRPTILVRNGDEGNISIADQIPIVQSSQITDNGSVNTTTGREDVGIILTVTPQISPDGYVTIKLEQEISNLSGENIQLSEGITQPIFSTREVSTNITIRDGETVVIGGLITSRRSEGVNRVPLIGDIPWLGELFKAQSYSEQKTELLIVMTVDVLHTDRDAHEMSVAERDRFVLPDRIRQSPLMEGLRILPDEALMGPQPVKNGRSEEGVKPSSTQPPAPGKDQYEGPRPKTYGPSLPKTQPTSTVERAVYGPKIVRNDPPARD